MSRVVSRIAVSLDGYAAGANQRREEPLGDGGERLHEWAFTDPVAESDADILARSTENVGAYVMGRNMFAGPGDGAWDPEWRGWWGEDPPYHVPVFVLTHHEHEPLPMQGGTTFHFVTDGIDAALERAWEAAGDRDVHVAGGASTVQQYLAAGRLDELLLHVAPIVLGAGERLLENVGDPKLEPVEVVASPAVTHLRYRVMR